MLTTLIVTLAMHAPAPGIVETTFYGLVEVQPAANGGTIGGYLIGEVPGGSDAGCALVVAHDDATGEIVGTSCDTQWQCSQHKKRCVKQSKKNKAGNILVFCACGGGE